MTASGGRTVSVGGRPDVDDGAGPQQRHVVHVHRRRPQRRRRRRPQRRVERRRAGRPAVRPADHRRHPRREAGRARRGTRRATTAAPITTYQLSVNGGGVDERRDRHLVHAHRARRQHDVHVPAAGRERRRRRRRRQHGVGQDARAAEPGRRAARQRRRRQISRDVVGAERQRQADQPLRGRAPTGRWRSQRRRHVQDVHRLEPDTTYTVRVRACNSIGCGPWSVEKSATTDAAADDHASAAAGPQSVSRAAARRTARSSTSRRPAWRPTPTSRSTASATTAAG